MNCFLQILSGRSTWAMWTWMAFAVTVLSSWPIWNCHFSRLSQSNISNAIEFNLLMASMCCLIARKSRLSPAGNKEAQLVLAGHEQPFGSAKDWSRRMHKCPKSVLPKCILRHSSSQDILWGGEENDWFRECCKQYSFPKISKLVWKYHISISKTLNGSTIKKIT